MSLAKTAQSAALRCSFVAVVLWLFIGLKPICLSYIFFFIFLESRINIFSKLILIKSVSLILEGKKKLVKPG